MAVKTSWAAGDVLLAADLTDTFAAKLNGEVASSAPATATAGKVWVDSGTKQGFFGTGSAWVPFTGKILQVVSTTKTDTFASNGAAMTYQDVTGLSATITPSSTTSKILVVCDSVWFPATANVTAVYLRLVRGSTAIGVGAAAGSRTQAGWGTVLPAVQYQGQNMSTHYVDSPASTSATTYKVQVATNSIAARLNYRGDDADGSDYGRFASTITLMEVAA